MEDRIEALEFNTEFLRQRVNELIGLANQHEDLLFKLMDFTIKEKLLADEGRKTMDLLLDYWKERERVKKELKALETFVYG